VVGAKSGHLSMERLTASEAEDACNSRRCADHTGISTKVDADVAHGGHSSRSRNGISSRGGSSGRLSSGGGRCGLESNRIGRDRSSRADASRSHTGRGCRSCDIIVAAGAVCVPVLTGVDSPCAVDAVVVTIGAVADVL